MKSTNKNEKVWIGKAQTNDHPITTSQFYDPFQKIVDDSVRVFLKHLEKTINSVMRGFTCELTLRQAEHDERLRRGLNELGLIAPDFGKEFTGLYFQFLAIEVHGDHNKNQENKDFVEKYIEEISINYFKRNPSPYSNWEFNTAHQSRLIYPDRFRTVLSVSFPKLTIQFINI